MEPQRSVSWRAERARDAETERVENAAEEKADN